MRPGFKSTVNSADTTRMEPVEHTYPPTMLPDGTLVGTPTAGQPQHVWRQLGVAGLLAAGLMTSGIAALNLLVQRLG
jgi:hypothetical protein